MNARLIEDEDNHEDSVEIVETGKDEEVDEIKEVEVEKEVNEEIESVLPTSTQQINMFTSSQLDPINESPDSEENETNEGSEGNEVKELDNIIYPKNIKVDLPNNNISVIHKIKNVFSNIKSSLSCLYPSSEKKT